MRVFDPTDPFIKSISQAVKSLGGHELPVFRGHRGETLNASWFPEMKNGLFCHDSDNDAWEELTSSDDHENLMLQISSDGFTSISQGDDSDVVYVETTLRAGDELAELLHFYETVDGSKIGTSNHVSRPLKNLLEGVYLLIPSMDGPGVIPLMGLDFAKAHPEVSRMIDAFFVDEDEEAMIDIVYWDLGQFLDDHDLRSSLATPQPLLPGDLLLDDSGDLLYGGIFLQDGHSTIGSSPALVLRPRAEVSRMWLSDYLEHAMESQELLLQICKNWKNLGQWLNTVQISLPSAKRDQIAASITRRLYRYLYQNRIRALTELREPFDQILPLYRKRLRAAHALHSELLDDLEAIQHPLPFFLEYPYRHFRNESDHLQKVRAGQRLLGILAKVPLFLVVEELIAAGHELGAVILEKLEERAPSDGTLAALQKWTAQELAKLPNSPLTVFRSLQPLMADTRELDAMVTARNRMHHEPYDEDGFLATMDELAPRVVDALRTALHGCRFIIPHHGKVVADEKIITADDVCNSDSHFRKIDLIVTLPLEQFHSGELIVWKPSPEQTLKLGKLLTSKLVTRQSRDFGIFDRMQKNERHFTFLRTE